MRDDWNNLLLTELFVRLIDDRSLFNLIDAAIVEDMGDAGDLTSQVCIPADLQATAQLRSRDEGRLAGGMLLGLVAKRYDQRITVTELLPDGAKLTSGTMIANVSGPLRSILSAERVMLNFVGRLSGIAGLTDRYVKAVEGTKARIYDTRKTTPGMRRLEKYAVRCGGGFCHRMGLYDAMLVKDNHIAHVPGKDLAHRLNTAIAAARVLRPAPVFVQVEVDTLEQLDIVLGCDVDIILLDNMPPDELRQAVARRDAAAPSVELEASGGVNLDTVAFIAVSGVDRISVGALTHSAPVADLGLDITPAK